MCPNDNHRVAQTILHLVAWARAARRVAPSAAYWAHQVVRDNQPYTFTAAEADFGLIKICLFFGPDLVCEVHAVGYGDELVTSVADICLPDAAAAFLSNYDDLAAPLSNESFEPF